MKISQLYTYPVKSLRETPISEAEVSRHGFLYDRRFMLLKVHTDDSPSERRLKNMHVADFPALTRFLTNIKFPEDDDDVGELYINWSKPGSDDVKSLTVPLRPETSGLELIEITMHSSPTKAYDMGSKYNDWFSSCLGYDVVFAYLGPYLRKVLMSTRPIRQPKSNGGWLSTITSTILGSANDEEQVTFADGAAYLVVSETSLQDVSSRLPEGQEMDITKFRPNIVVTEADKIWDEDFWHEIQIGDIKITLAQNCGRCKSINIDYATGAPGKDQTGRILAKLQKDRRIDKGAKYSPVFGRYGFLVSGGEGKRIAVGDEVTVTKRGTEYTKFDWPGVAIEA